MLGWLFGGKAVDTVEAVADGLGGLFTSDDERLTHVEVLQRIKQQPDKMQAAVNAVEARHRSLFVAGWRPFIGWVCGVALAYQFLILPLISWIVTIAMDAPIYPPVVETGALYSVLLGMLGLGGLRTYEKAAGVTK